MTVGDNHVIRGKTRTGRKTDTVHERNLTFKAKQEATKRDKLNKETRIVT